MNFDHLDGTNPTILSEDPIQYKETVLPGLLLSAIADRIKGQKKLYNKLCLMWEDRQRTQMNHLVEIIADWLIALKVRSRISLEKNRAIDLSKKTQRRWKNKALPKARRLKQIKKFTRVAHREMIARNAAEVTAAKKLMDARDYYSHFIKRLYYYFDALSPSPYLFVAALIGLFGLHPRDFCHRCPHFPTPRKKSIMIDSLATQIRRGIRMCQLDDILACPRREIGRQNIWITINR